MDFEKISEGFFGNIGILRDLRILMFFKDFSDNLMKFQDL